MRCGAAAAPERYLSFGRAVPTGLGLRRSTRTWRCCSGPTHCPVQSAAGYSNLLTILFAAPGSRNCTPARDALAWVFEIYGDAAGATLEYLRSGTVAQRILLAQELPLLYSRLKPDMKAGMVEILKAGLEDESADVRSAVVVSLAGLDESAEALVPVLSAIALDRDSDVDMRRVAIKGWELTGVCPPDLAEELVALAAAQGEDYDVRRSAVNILAAAGSTVKDVAGMILDNLSALGEDWQWRLAPLIVEAGRADQAIVKRLVGWLEVGRPEAGHPEAGHPEAGRPEVERPETERLEAGPEAVDRLYAIRVLSAIGSHAKSGVPALTKLLASESDPLYRRAITRALVEIASSGEDVQVDEDRQGDPDAGLARMHRWRRRAERRECTERLCYTEQRCCER